MIGVDNETLTLTPPSHYKRSILFYDQMLLMQAPRSIYEWREGPYSKKRYHAYADEMEFLLETPHFLPPDKLSGIPVQGETAASLRAAIRETNAQARAALPDDGGLTVPFEEFARLHSLGASLETRLAAESLTSMGQPAISAYTVPRIARGATSSSLVAGDVIRLAIDKVMIPDESTSWEDILALKADKDLQERARKLRLWAVKIAKSENSIALAEEHVADLLADYERFLRAHRLKYGYTTLEAVITQSAEFLEDLLKLRVAKLASRFFSVNKTKADMTLSELKAPGRELSLVTSINDRFA